ncbi:MAG: hypothetical protein QME96_14160, partial [Myxococcota bacterium]|nr:hypothetical protein [Myxococcota bacterium]
YWRPNMPSSVQTTNASRYRFNIYHINHATAPFNTLNRGYIISLDGTLTTGGMNTSLFMTVNNCRSPWYILSCDDETFHFMSGPAGQGSQIVTGRIPAGWWAGVIVTNWANRACGNYTMRVALDDDGDGVPDTSDGSNALLRGSVAATTGENGALVVPSWPWGAHGYSYAYPNNSLTALPGREVYYYRVNPAVGSMNIKVYPRIRGDVWGGAASNLWDAGIWVYLPVAVSVRCNTGAWAMRSGWQGCDSYGAGTPETWSLSNAPGGQTYYFAVDSYTATPRGGWYTIEFN